MSQFYLERGQFLLFYIFLQQILGYLQYIKTYEITPIDIHLSHNAKLASSHA